MFLPIFMWYVKMCVVVCGRMRAHLGHCFFLLLAFCRLCSWCTIPRMAPPCRLFFHPAWCRHPDDECLLPASQGRSPYCRQCQLLHLLDQASLYQVPQRAQFSACSGCCPVLYIQTISSPFLLRSPNEPCCLFLD